MSEQDIINMTKNDLISNDEANRIWLKILNGKYDETIRD